MCNKAVDNYPHTLKFVSKCYKTHKLYDKAVIIYTSTIKFVPEYYKTQEMCDKGVTRYFFYMILFLTYIKIKKCVTALFLKIVL